MRKGIVWLSGVATLALAHPALAQEGGIAPANTPSGNGAASPLSPPGDQQGSNTSATDTDLSLIHI